MFFFVLQRGAINLLVVRRPFHAQIRWVFPQRLATCWYVSGQRSTLQLTRDLNTQEGHNTLW